MSSIIQGVIFVSESSQELRLLEVVFSGSFFEDLDLPCKFCEGCRTNAQPWISSQEGLPQPH